MSANRSSYSAKFINYEYLSSDFKYRRLNFKDVRDSRGIVVKNILCIDESESLIIIGHLNYGDIVSFTADVNFTNIEFCYPHSPLILK